MNDPLFSEDDVIHRVTRAQLIEDGDLIDVTEQARATGFRVPLALSRAVWFDCVEWTEEDNRRQVHQDPTGRLHDLLFLCHISARQSQASSISFEVLRVPRGGTAHMPRPTPLVAFIGPGDEGEPVITIMQPGED